jgi:TonB family protein
MDVPVCAPADSPSTDVGFNLDGNIGVSHLLGLGSGRIGRERFVGRVKTLCAKSRRIAAGVCMALAEALPADAQVVGGAQHIIVNPSMLAPPSPAQMAAEYPPSAARLGVGGDVRLQCVVMKTGILVHCAIAQETPPGQGFGEAALRLAPDFRMIPRTVDGAPADGEVVIIPVRFSAPQTVELRSFPVVNPSVSCADVEPEMASYYPDRAQRLNVEGTARAVCKVGGDGKTTQCTWIAVDPPSFGFGPAAAKLGCIARFKPPAGAYGTGERFMSFPYCFKLPSH